jgi:hypothetical protein
MNWADWLLIGVGLAATGLVFWDRPRRWRDEKTTQRSARERHEQETKP